MRVQSLKEMRLWVSGRCYVPEAEALAPLLEAAAPFKERQPSIFADAAFLLQRARALKEPPHETLMRQFSLETPQGRKLMRLMEALPRIPDTATAQSLIAEIFADPCWEEAPEKVQSLLSSIAGTGIKIAHSMFLPGKKNFLQKAFKDASFPLIHKALLQVADYMADGFVLGQTLRESLEKVAHENYRDYLYSFDMLGEAAKTAQQAEHYFTQYLNTITTTGIYSPKSDWIGFRNGVSVKLSALYPRFTLTHRKQVMGHLYPKLKKLALAAMKSNVLLTIDAEEASRFDLTLELYEMLLLEPELKGFDGIGLALQAYQKRAYPALDYLIQLAKETGRKLPIRLVKGAYWDGEIKQAQIGGFSGYPVFTQKAFTDVSYLACARKIMDHPDQLWAQFATHNAHTVTAILKYAKPHNRFEFQKLLGMGDRIHQVLAEEYVCRIYAPVGNHATLLPYLIRRILENGANTSFLHLLSEEKSDKELLACPVTASLAAPAATLPLPQAIYGKSRRNSAGRDLGNLDQLQALKSAVAPYSSKHWRAGPLIDGKFQKTSETRTIASPSNIHSVTGDCHYATALEVMKAVTLAEGGFPQWQRISVARRAAILEKAADLLEADSAEAIALLVYEASKTLSDALAEIRETIDFLRYYAAEARRVLKTGAPLDAVEGEENIFSLRGRGVFLCISPWNFPLAIFTGQIAAALVTGNTVVAKPAEQTPLIAFHMTQLLLKAGTPPYALQLLPGSGDTVGQRLVAEPKIAGVVFTGSSETARRINMTLSQRTNGIIPFIAETGGQNAMVMDSSALPEQALDDILLSSFGASGQRCSALRVLYVPEEIADTFLPILKEAAMQLNIGFPEDLDTDIGSVINPEAQEKIGSHIERYRKRILFQLPIPAIAQRKGCYVPPTCLQMHSILELENEIFGPVLHVIRYKWGEIDTVLKEINSTNYALTFGIHSRLESRIALLTDRIQAGNIYINRGMVGAVVGQQPFGGHGLSGTGYKAGGPNYLMRFVTETCTTTNTAAFGGNVQLLARRNHGI